MPFPSFKLARERKHLFGLISTNSELRAAVSVDKLVLCKSNSRMGSCCALIDSRSVTKGFGHQQATTCPSSHNRLPFMKTCLRRVTTSARAETSVRADVNNSELRAAVCRQGCFANRIREWENVSR
ncbi:hypothetical protein CEXT_733931 [Caerostris extrusa]|uniref:Uncharacterized protein n=1 Tax=Caerostris extrusa TaxID=172846 RepID=A0AAV4WBQ1_CAEEX|nr:hypothetical protein CEXT_733931 [Caerostris extrusa]